MKLIVLISILQAAASTAVHHSLIDTHPQQLSTQPIHEGFTSGSGSGSAFFAGFILGPLLFFSTCICIWFNEKRAAIDSRRLKLAASICEVVDVNNQASADYQNGKLVYACGQTRTDSITRDSVSGVMSPNLIKINRYVEVMEWRRHTRNNDRTSETYHTLNWTSVHSESEGVYRNPPENWFIQNEVTYNNQVFLGGYNIDKATADLCEKVIPFTPTMEHANNIMMNTANRERTPYISG